MQALLGVLGVQRHVGATGLEHRQQADNHVQPALHGNAHPHIRAYTLLDQLMGQLVGPLVELAIAQLLAGAQQRHGIRSACGLGLDQLLDAERRQVSRRSTAALLLDQAALGSASQRQLTDARLRLLHQRHEHLLQVARQLPDVRLGAMLQGIAVVERQGLPQVHRQGQRVVGLLMVGRHAEAQLRRCTLGQGLGHRVVLEHQDIVEQRLTPQARPALHVVQRRVFEIAQGQVAFLHQLQPVTDRHVRARRSHDRQRVDEQADLLLHALELRRAPGHGGTEHHAVLPGVALQQQQPRGLHQGVDRDLLLAGELAQALRLLQVQVLLMGGVALAGQGLATAADGLGQTGWLIQDRQLLLPEGLAELGVLALQPGDVVAVAPGRMARELPRIALQHFPEQP